MSRSTFFDKWAVNFLFIKVRLCFPPTCLATLLHCKLKPTVAHITTFVTNLSRSKIQCCTFSESCAYD